MRHILNNSQREESLTFCKGNLPKLKIKVTKRRYENNVFYTLHFWVSKNEFISYPFNNQEFTEISNLFLNIQK